MSITAKQDIIILSLVLRSLLSSADVIAGCVVDYMQWVLTALRPRLLVHSGSSLSPSQLSVYGAVKLLVVINLEITLELQLSGASGDDLESDLIQCSVASH